MLCRANNLPVPLVRNDSLDCCELLPDMDDSRRDDDCGAHGCSVDVGYVEISGQPANPLAWLVRVCVDPDWRAQCERANSQVLPKSHGRNQCDRRADIEEKCCGPDMEMTQGVSVALPHG